MPGGGHGPLNFLFQHRSLLAPCGGRLWYVVYFQSWTDVLAVTSKAFRDVFASLEIRAGKLHSCGAGDQSQSNIRSRKRVFIASYVYAYVLRREIHGSSPLTSTISQP
jgi:hypothetical protein